MSEFQQARPLSEAQFSPIAVSDASPTTIHAMSSLSPSAGGPQTDQLTVYLHNSSGSDAEVTLTIQGGSATLVLAVPSNTTRTALLSQPFIYDSAAGAFAGLIQAQETTAQPTSGVVAFGSFTRA